MKGDHKKRVVYWSLQVVTQVTCDYCFDHRHTWKDAFLFLHDTGLKQLKNLQKHLKQNGAVPREHGFTDHLPATTYPYEIVCDTVHFIVTMQRLSFHNRQQEVEKQIILQFTSRTLASYPGRKRQPGTHCLCMRVINKTCSQWGGVH